MKLNASLVGVASTLLCVVATAKLQASEIKPGGIAVIPMPVVVDDGSTPTVRYGRRKVLLLRESARWLAVVGITRTTVPGEYIVTAGTGKSDAREFRFRVRPGDASTAMPDEDPAFAAHHQFDESRYARLPLKRPVFGEVRKPFAMNFPAEEITTENAGSIVSPGNGVIHAINAAGPTGESVTINHGQGVYSVLSPIYQLRVKINEEVVQSQILGVAGTITTGAIAGIRWQVTLNGALVNPDLLTRWPTVKAQKQ